jgi:hypothetical protein
VEFIFSKKKMATTMSALNMNATNLPQGNLSTERLSSAYLALRDLSEALTTPSHNLMAKDPDISTLHELLENLTARYYT